MGPGKAIKPARIDCITAHAAGATTSAPGEPAPGRIFHSLKIGQEENNLILELPGPRPKGRKKPPPFSTIHVVNFRSTTPAAPADLQPSRA